MRRDLTQYSNAVRHMPEERSDDMPEDVEIETKELQETIEELQEERRDREQEERRSAWTRYVALTTAFLAVFAAVGALQSGALVNEAMMLQIQASDKWNEYQAARQKDHLYTLGALTLLDRLGHSATAPGHSEAGATKERQSDKREWMPLPPEQRLGQYIRQVNKEAQKEEGLKREAEVLEKDSEERMHRHHEFAQSVALNQVAIALSAVAALSRMKSIWAVSLLAGLTGCVLTVLGLVR